MSSSVSFGLLNLDQVSYDAIYVEDFEVIIGRRKIYRFKLAVVATTSNFSWMVALAPRLLLMWPVRFFTRRFGWSLLVLYSVPRFLGYF